MEREITADGLEMREEKCDGKQRLVYGECSAGPAEAKPSVGPFPKGHG